MIDATAPVEQVSAAVWRAVEERLGPLPSPARA